MLLLRFRMRFSWLHVNGITGDGRVGQCSARKETANPAPHNGENQPE